MLICVLLDPGNKILSLWNGLRWNEEYQWIQGSNIWCIMHASQGYMLLIEYIFNHIILNIFTTSNTVISGLITPNIKPPCSEPWNKYTSTTQTEIWLLVYYKAR